MALLGIRSTIQRFVIVTGLALALVVGSVALGPNSDASAMPMSCSSALTLARMNIGIGDVLLGLGDYATARYYYGRADAYLTLC